VLLILSIINIIVIIFGFVYLPVSPLIFFSSLVLFSAIYAFAFEVVWSPKNDFKMLHLGYKTDSSLKIVIRNPDASQAVRIHSLSLFLFFFSGCEISSS